MRSLIPTLRGPVQRRRTEPGIGRHGHPAVAGGSGPPARGEGGQGRVEQAAPGSSRRDPCPPDREWPGAAPDGGTESLQERAPSRGAERPGCADPAVSPHEMGNKGGPRITDLAAAWDDDSIAEPGASSDRAAPDPRRAETAPNEPRRKLRAGEGNSAACSPLPTARRPAGKGGPGPSKLDYRLRRAWAKSGLRNAVLVYLPLALLGLVGWRLAADDAVRARIDAGIASIVDRLAERPEFAVRSVGVRGASPDLAVAVRETVALAPGTSSLRLDLETIRQSVEALGAVRTARVRLDPQGVLEVGVTERVAKALWRNEVGGLVLLDAEGVIIGLAAERAERPDLPLVLGEGARARVDEALDLITAARDLRPRIRALVRVGQRRWDVVLENTVVMLPEADSAGALARVMALHRGEALLDRDLAAIDMRLPNRPTLRLTPGAVETYRLHKVTVAEAGEET